MFFFYEPDTLYTNTNFSFPYSTRTGGGIFIKRVRFIILEKKNINYFSRSYCALTFNNLYIFTFFRCEKKLNVFGVIITSVNGENDSKEKRKIYFKIKNLHAPVVLDGQQTNIGTCTQQDIKRVRIYRCEYKTRYKNKRLT